jgi:hypothetical protein
MPRKPEEPAPEATLKRGNESVVAGLHCVSWSWTEDVETRTVCMTEDGVLLRFLIDGKTASEVRTCGSDAAKRRFGPIADIDAFIRLRHRR